MHQPKIGDKFKLGEWEWMVSAFDGYDFMSVVKEGSSSPSIWFRLEDADKLQWITPKPTCSKEFAEEMKKWIETTFVNPNGRVFVDPDAIDTYLSDHTESET